MEKLKDLSIFKSSSPEDTACIAAAFAASAKGGEIILLEGPIGAGKTWFTRELARAIGVKKLPASASFGMMRSYKGKKLKLYHFDLFRAGEEDMENLGVEEFFGMEDGISIMEWSEAASSMADKTGYVKMIFELAGGNSRIIKTYAIGRRAKSFLKKTEEKWKKISA